ncbi:MAG: type II toxin-antitoxin system RelB/DinJ family antitoxin [Desulfovibrio sp.]|jgi:addiction module RelB/DinJ family antitoxin|nr:type II toxin-antitoxin system RelB/DinJ family antitoxin [Desulfovibrio sp.]
MATIQIRVDDNVKAAADSLFASLGLDTSTAVRMFIAAALDNRGIPFSVKKTRQPMEINDGFGSYICEYGHFHDYSKLKSRLDEAAKDTAGPFNSVDDLMKSLNDE